MDSQQQNSHLQVQFTDDDEVPPQYRVERHTSEHDGTRGRVRSGNSHPQRSNRRTPCTLPFHRTKRRADAPIAPQAAPVNDSSWISRIFIRIVTPTSQRSFSNTKDERKQKENIETLPGIQDPQERDYNVDQTQVSQRRVAELEHQFQDILKGKECEWMEREKDLQNKIHQAQQNTAEREQVLQSKIEDIQLAKSALEAQYNAFIRKQQEVSFRQMESARWLPLDETKVLSDLDKLKKDMRSWAKTTSIKDISTLNALGEVESTALMQQLSNVIVMEDSYLPRGIFTTAKSPMLLLNALLTDHIYMTFFQSPFFFLEGSFKDSSSNSQPESVLEDIYQRAKTGKPILAYYTVPL
jgi:hypothetical protein